MTSVNPNCLKSEKNVISNFCWDYVVKFSSASAKICGNERLWETHRQTHRHTHKHTLTHRQGSPAVNIFSPEVTEYKNTHQNFWYHNRNQRNNHRWIHIKIITELHKLRPISLCLIPSKCMKCISAVSKKMLVATKWHASIRMSFCRRVSFCRQIGDKMSRGDKMTRQNPRSAGLLEPRLGDIGGGWKTSL